MIIIISCCDYYPSFPPASFVDCVGNRTIIFTDGLFFLYGMYVLLYVHLVVPIM